MKIVGQASIAGKYVLLGSKIENVQVVFYRGYEDTFTIPTCERNIIQLIKDLSEHKFGKAHLFTNKKKTSEKLPEKEKINYYLSYYLQTPGYVRSPERLVVGKEGEVYYSPDHYGKFILLTKPYLYRGYVSTSQTYLNLISDTSFI